MPPSAEEQHYRQPRLRLRTTFVVSAALDSSVNLLIDPSFLHTTGGTSVNVVALTVLIFMSNYNMIYLLFATCVAPEGSHPPHVPEYETVLNSPTGSTPPTC